eukprot:NODE_1274_length_925_cov_109.858396_g1228_i0.p1 GENE.NODE_1274_length_925_cov_109.858396_g1228_i0~~NODE_1274_length_925_cov_109.858396_g1228_i0.p1  ORF type:complete len:307 (-),score=51.70 NODE_1274_length_925_cov_109.858396_g1228_i0:4-885(-)
MVDPTTSGTQQPTRAVATTDFAHHFNKTADALSNDIDNSSVSPHVRKHILNLDARIQTLKHEFNKACIYLPHYDIATYSKRLNQLATQLLKTEEELIPPTKFRFKSRKKYLDRVKQQETELSSIHNLDEGSPEKQPDSPSLVDDDDTYTLTGRNNDVVCMESLEGSTALSVTKVDHCQIFVGQCTQRVYVTNARDTTIVVSPVSGSVFIDQCDNCTFVLFCHQLRIHRSNGIKLVLHVTSNPIMEDCQNIQVSPNTLDYPLKSIQFQNAGLSPDVNKWRHMEKKKKKKKKTLR